MMRKTKAETSQKSQRFPPSSWYYIIPRPSPPTARTKHAKTLKLRFRVGDLDLPERRKRYPSSREEEIAQMYPCGKAVESRSHIVGEREIYKEEWEVLRDEENRRMWHGEVWYTR